MTEDVAQAVLNKAQNEYRPVSIVAQEFLVRTLGLWMRRLWATDVLPCHPLVEVGPHVDQKNNCGRAKQH